MYFSKLIESVHCTDKNVEIFILQQSWNLSIYGYEIPLMERFLLPSLSFSRIAGYLLCIHKLVNGFFGNAYLLNKISVYVPAVKSQPKQLFFFNRAHTSQYFSSPL